jgi:hypothetical protein
MQGRERKQIQSGTLVKWPPYNEKTHVVHTIILWTCRKERANPGTAHWRKKGTGIYQFLSPDS